MWLVNKIFPVWCFYLKINAHPCPGQSGPSLLLVLPPKLACFSSCIPVHPCLEACALGCSLCPECSSPKSLLGLPPCCLQAFAKILFSPNPLFKVHPSPRHSCLPDLAVFCISLNIFNILNDFLKLVLPSPRT